MTPACKLVVGEAVEDLGNGPSGCFGDGHYPKVCVKRSLKDFDDEKTLAVREPSEVGVKLCTHLDVDLLNSAGATTGAAIGIPDAGKCANRRSWE